MPDLAAEKHPAQPRASGPAAGQELIRCPNCMGSLSTLDDFLGCMNAGCGMRFPMADGIPVLINDHSSVFTRGDFQARKSTTFDLSRKRWIQRLDESLPKLGRNLKSKENYKTFGRLLLRQSPKPLVLVIGGSVLGGGMGELASNPDIQLVETDVTFGPRTKVICDAHELPFGRHTFDGVIIQAVMQYLIDPARCVREIERVLKPEGLVYAESAFMQQVVHGRYDFFRFTHLGLRRLFRGFDEVESGPTGGPGMALAWAGQFFLLSFATSRWTRRAMHAIGRLSLFWLKFFDPFLLRKAGTYDAASGFFFLGRKSEKPISDRELVSLYRGAQ